MHPRDPHLMAIAMGDYILIYDCNICQTIHTLKGHTHNVKYLAYAPDGSQLASASDDNTVRLWDLHGEKHPRVLAGHTQAITCLTYAPDGSQLASGSKDHTVRLWDTRRGVCSQIWQAPAPVSQLLWCADALVIGCDNGIVAALKRQPSASGRWALVWLQVGRLSTLKFTDCDFTGVQGLQLFQRTLINQRGGKNLELRLPGSEKSQLETPRPLEHKININNTMNSTALTTRSTHHASFFSRQLGYHSPNSRNTLLTQAEQLLNQVYPPESKGNLALLRQSYQTKLADFRKRLDTLTKADKDTLKQLVKKLRELRDSQKLPGQSAGRQRATTGGAKQWFSLKKSKTADDVKESRTTSSSVLSTLSTDTSTIDMISTATHLDFGTMLDELPIIPMTSGLTTGLTTLLAPPEKKQAGSRLTAPHAQFFPPKSEEKYPVPTYTPALTLGTLLEQAQGLLDTACPPSAPVHAELRRGFVKQLAEYKRADPAKPPTLTQQQALQSMMQTLRDIQASPALVCSSR